MTEIDWTGVRERLAALASTRKAGHGFVLKPVLSASSLAEFEQAAGVRLPADHRSFLLEVGNGGAGPGYGMRSLPDPDGHLGVPFEPFDQALVDQRWATRPVAEDFPDEESFRAAGRAWIDREDDLYEQEGFGTLVLADQGCGHTWRLVVSGPHRGTVWDDARGSDVPLTQLTGPGGEPLTFGGWYREWLTEAEA